MAYSPDKTKHVDIQIREALAELINILKPSVAVEQDVLTATVSWQSIALPAGTVKVHFGLAGESAFVSAKTSTPSKNGCGYGAAGSHELYIADGDNLWYKRNHSSDVAITWTAFTR